MLQANERDRARSDSSEKTQAHTPRVRGVLPGFKPTLAITLSYLSLIVLVPLAGLVLKIAGLSWREFWQAISGPRALAAYRLSVGGALIAALVNASCGLVIAWVLVRHRFSGRAIADALVDLPL